MDDSPAQSRQGLPLQGAVVLLKHTCPSLGHMHTALHPPQSHTHAHMPHSRVPPGVREQVIWGGVSPGSSQRKAIHGQILTPNYQPQLGLTVSALAWK